MQSASNTMKKALLLLSIFSALSFSLWLARQLADSGATLETASQAYLRGDYADALRAHESLAAGAGQRRRGRRPASVVGVATGRPRGGPMKAWRPFRARARTKAVRACFDAC